MSASSPNWSLGQLSVDHGFAYNARLLSHDPPLRVVDAGGNGDCMFRSVAAFLIHDPQEFQLYRELVASWLETNARSDLAQRACQTTRMVEGKQQAFGTVAKYCEVIRGKGWGGFSIDLQILADFLQLDFEILPVDLSPPFNVRSHSQTVGSPARPCYALCFRQGHVQPLFPVDASRHTAGGCILRPQSVHGVSLGEGEEGQAQAALQISASNKDRVAAHKCATCVRSTPVADGPQCDLCQYDCARRPPDTLTPAELAENVRRIEEVYQQIQRELGFAVPAALVLMFVLPGDTHQSLKESVQATTWKPELPGDTEWVEDGIALMRELQEPAVWADTEVDRAFVTAMRIELARVCNKSASVEDSIMAQLRSSSIETVVGAAQTTSAALSKYLLLNQVDWVFWRPRLVASVWTPEMPKDASDPSSAVSKGLQSSLAIVIRAPENVRSLLEARRRSEAKAVAEPPVVLNLEDEDQEQELEADASQAAELQLDAFDYSSAEDPPIPLATPEDSLPVPVVPLLPSEPPPSFFQDAQVALARRIIQTVRASFEEHWSRFRRVDYRVVLPRFNQLQLQTADRARQCGLLELEAGSESTSGSDTDADSRSKVWKYDSAGVESLKAWSALVPKNPTTLFVLIVDECEWGATKDSWHDWIVNDAEMLRAPNTIRLLVSATPHALMTRRSRVPLNEPPVGYRVLQTVPGQTATVGHVLSRSNPADRAAIDAHRAHDGASSLQPLRHHIEWFEKQQVTHGMLLILRSFDRLLLVSTETADRLKRCSELAHGSGPAGSDEDDRAQLAVGVSHDSSFASDQFQLQIVGALVSESPGEKRLRVRLLHVHSKRFVQVGAVLQRADRLYHAVLGPTESELEMCLYDGDTKFDLTATAAQGQRVRFVTHVEGGSATACFVAQPASTSVLPPGFEHHFYFGELYGGYRSLDLHIATQANADVARANKWVRADPMFKMLGKSASPMLQQASMLSQWSKDGASKNCAQFGSETCLKYHRGGTCFTDGHLLLADYVYCILRAAATNFQTRGQITAAQLKTLDDLIGRFISSATSQAACPLMFVRQFYRDHPAHQLDALRKAAQASAEVGSAPKLDSISTQQQQSALSWATWHCSPSAVAKLKGEYQLEPAPTPPTDSVTETELLVCQLFAHLPIPSDRSASWRARGKMVVLRVDNQLQGLCIQAGLLHALGVANIHHDFAIIPDFGRSTLAKLPAHYLAKLQPGRSCADCDCAQWTKPNEQHSAQCGRCGHEHHRVRHYEDLLHLPCIVLLDEKGRMGDTFPHSFACMDLRLRYQNDSGTLRSVTQELGRMCRYVTPKRKTATGASGAYFACSKCGERYEDCHAYALVGHKLLGKLQGRSALEGHLKPLSERMVACQRVPLNPAAELADSATPFVFCAFDPKDSYDTGPLWPKQDPRRFLLHAECQIGKTGTYLSVIEQLWREFSEVKPNLLLLLPQALAATPDAYDLCDGFHPSAEVLKRAPFKFPLYSALKEGKYHGRVVLNRLKALFERVPGTMRHRSMRDFVSWVRRVEIAVSRNAHQMLSVSTLQSALALPNDLSPTDLLAHLLPALNWDGRMSSLQTQFNALHRSTSASSSSAAAESTGPGSEVALLLKHLDHWNASAIPSFEEGALAAMWNRPMSPASALVPRSEVPSTVHASFAARTSDGSQARTVRTVQLIYPIDPAQNCMPPSQFLFFPDKTTLRISAPSLADAKKYFVLESVGDRHRILSVRGAAESDLRHFIFNCTYNRRGKAMLDYADTMITSTSIQPGGVDGQRITFRRMIVCRKQDSAGLDEFERQVDEWGGAAFVLCLPDRCNYPMYNERGEIESVVDSTPSDGGVGYARLCVQVLAHMWRLAAVWLLDDNILRFRHCAPRLASGEVLVQTVPFGAVLRRMEELMLPVRSNGNVSARSGGASKYALIGTGRNELHFLTEPLLRGVMQRPHNLTHVYSACLINIDACFKNESGRMVLFPPRPVWEDVEFNFLARDAGLLIVKYARIVHLKRNYTKTLVSDMAEEAADRAVAPCLHYWPRSSVITLSDLSNSTSLADLPTLLRAKHPEIISRTPNSSDTDLRCLRFWNIIKEPWLHVPAHERLANEQFNLAAMVMRIRLYLQHLREMLPSMPELHVFLSANARDLPQCLDSVAAVAVPEAGATADALVRRLHVGLVYSAAEAEMPRQATSPGEAPMTSLVQVYGSQSHDRVLAQDATVLVELVMGAWATVQPSPVSPMHRQTEIASPHAQKNTTTTSPAALRIPPVPPATAPTSGSKKRAAPSVAESSPKKPHASVGNASSNPVPASVAGASAAAAMPTSIQLSPVLLSRGQNKEPMPNAPPARPSAIATRSSSTGAQPPTGRAEGVTSPLKRKAADSAQAEAVAQKKAKAQESSLASAEKRPSVPRRRWTPAELSVVEHAVLQYPGSLSSLTLTSMKVHQRLLLDLSWRMHAVNPAKSGEDVVNYIRKVFTTAQNENKSPGTRKNAQEQLQRWETAKIKFAEPSSVPQPAALAAAASAAQLPLSPSARPPPFSLLSAPGAPFSPSSSAVASASPSAATQSPPAVAAGDPSCQMDGITFSSADDMLRYIVDPSFRSRA